MQWRISETELSKRHDRLCEALRARELAGAYLTQPLSVFYLTGFFMVSTERPAGLVVPLKGDAGFVGPRLEEHHARAGGGRISLVRTYFDYPGRKHPMEAIADFLREMGMGKGRIGTDNPAGYESRWGYAGPKLADLLPRAEFVAFDDYLRQQRKVKSEEEIALLRESCRWADAALSKLVERTSPGVWDVEASLEATLEATGEMKRTLGEAYRQSVFGDAPASAGFRGQVGPESAIPHTFATNRRIQKGDVLGSGASAEVGGYHCELERTLILGKASGEQAEAFEVMLRAQEAAIGALRPGAPCAAADEAAYDVFEKAGLADRTLHHTGHGLGLDFHEPPFLDAGEEEILKPGMVFAVEPGIYLPGFAGFRHSDTVLITETGAERLTRFPRDLASCTIPARGGKRKRKKAGKKKTAGKGKAEGRKKAGKGGSAKGRKKTAGRGKAEGRKKAGGGKKQRRKKTAGKAKKGRKKKAGKGRKKGGKKKSAGRGRATAKR